MKRREFSRSTKLAAFDRAKGKCEQCGSELWPGRIEYDHILPAALSGDNSLGNCAVLCRGCHSAKSAERDVPAIRKADRQRAVYLGARKPKRPMKSRGFGKAEPQRNASRPLDKWRAWETEA